MKRTIRAVFFDFGGVFVDRVGPSTFRLASRLAGVPEEVVKERFFRYHHRHQTGQESLAACWRRIFRELGGPVLPRKASRMIVGAYQRLAKPRPAMFRLANALRKRGIRVGLISDTCEEHARVNFRRGFYRGFRPLVLSHKVGFKKPGTRIFRIALKKAGVKAVESVFIDDRPENLVFARRMGFHTILFRGSRDLMVKLRWLKLL